MTNPDFTFCGTLGASATTPAKPLTPRDIARLAAVECHRIRTTLPVGEWKSAIAAAPEEIRLCLREYLLSAYRELQHKARVAEGRNGPVAAAEIEKLRELVR